MGKRLLGSSVFIVLVESAAVLGQTCPRPPAECEGTLHCGGEWDFENGFYFTSHYLAGQCAGPPGGAISCVPGDKKAQVAIGWTHWAAFPDWPTAGYWGTVSFNENKNCDNVYRGNRSQELTMTCANGVGVIYKQAAVPVDHRIRLEAHMKFTPNGAAPDVEHALGIDPFGGTDPTASHVQWVLWQEQTPSPPQPAGVFNQGFAEAVSMGPVITVFIRQRAFEPECQGQTFMIDHVRVIDLGPSAPTIDVTLTSLAVSAVFETDALPVQLSLRNSGTQSLDYTISTDASWLQVSPELGSLTTETQALDVTFDTNDMLVGLYEAAITIEANAINSPQVVPVTLTISSKPGDFDQDGDVDQEDFGWFQRCYSGAGVSHAAGCGIADMDLDNDVDPADFDLFQGCFSGPDVSSNPNCRS